MINSLSAFTSPYWPYGRSIGTSGLIGGLLLVASLAANLGVLQPARDDVDALQQQLAIAAPAVSSRPAGGESRVATPEESLSRFYRSLPATADLTDVLERVHLAAAASGLLLKSGDYRLQQQDQEGALARYEMALPLSGTYAQLRSFVGEVLSALPTAALEDVSIRRETIGQARSESVLRLVVFIRGD